jgi:hypothetical protein
MPEPPIQRKRRRAVEDEEYFPSEYVLKEYDSHAANTWLPAEVCVPRTTAAEYAYSAAGRGPLCGCAEIRG